MKINRISYILSKKRSGVYQTMNNKMLLSNSYIISYFKQQSNNEYFKNLFIMFLWRPRVSRDCIA